MTDQLLVETAERVFADTCTFEAVQQAEKVGWAKSVWSSIAGIGLPWISVPEELGGAGGSLADALAVVRIAGRFAAPVPLAETGLLAGWLCSGAGIRVVEGPSTIVPGRREDSVQLVDGVLSGTAHQVPWARAAQRLVVLVEENGRSMVVVVGTADLVIEPGTNMAGEPRDTVTFQRLEASEVRPSAPGVNARALRFRGALTRAVMMAGALEGMSELTVGYANERVQFGKPIAHFQAVQQHLVHVVQQATLAAVAADMAVRALGRGEARFEIAAAKVLTDQGAGLATRAAHQVHGAMGMTQEYPLHHFSRRLWAWRREYGGTREWSAELGRALRDLGADQLYPAITGGSDVVANL